MCIELTRLLLIGLGGGLGAVLRHVIGTACLRFLGASFPASTMVVNVSGCLLFGVLAALFAGPHALREGPFTWLLIFSISKGLLVLMQLAMARVARIYHRPRFQV